MRIDTYLDQTHTLSNKNMQSKAIFACVTCHTSNAFASPERACIKCTTFYVESMLLAMFLKKQYLSKK